MDLIAHDSIASVIRELNLRRELPVMPKIELSDISEMLSLPDRIDIITYSPHQCTCGIMTTVFINRDGRTRCATCDSEDQAARQ